MVRDVLSAEAPGRRDFLSASLLFGWPLAPISPRGLPGVLVVRLPLITSSTPSCGSIPPPRPRFVRRSRRPVCVRSRCCRAFTSRCITLAVSSPAFDRFDEPCRLSAISQRPEPWCSFPEARISGRVSSPVGIRLRCASRPATWRCRRFRRFAPISRKWRPTVSSRHAHVRRAVGTPSVPGTISPT